MTAVVCDWLDLTFPPLEKLSWFENFMQELGGVCRRDGDNATYLMQAGGVVKLQNNKNWIRLSVSGQVLFTCRTFGAMNKFLQLLSQQPHTITRLDAALDVSLDAPAIIRGLVKRYRRKGAMVRLSKKPVEPKWFLGPRADGQVTGTFYAGNHRTGKVTARVYDKQLEALERRKQLLPPTTRYEVTVKTNEVTLRDVDEPAAVFWHYASPALLPRPAGVPEWVPGNPYAWASDDKPPVDIKIRMVDAVEYSDDLARLCGWSDLLGDGGRDYLLKLLVRQIRK